MEFRFPKIGDFAVRAAAWRWSCAQCPRAYWHVMGEEGAIGGTVRFVDSSVEPADSQWQPPACFLLAVDVHHPCHVTGVGETH